MVEFMDGSIKAQIGAPDMRLPMQYALNFPERVPNNYRRMNWLNGQSLNFKQPDIDRFPCLALAFKAGRAGGTYPAVLSAADEIAVELFLQNKIDFIQIATILKKTLDSHSSVQNPQIEDILAADIWGRDFALSLV